MPSSSYFRICCRERAGGRAEYRRTLSLIDAFLATVPEEHSQTTELDYAMDYTAYLMQDDEDTDEADTSSTVPVEVPSCVDRI